MNNTLICCLLIFLILLFYLIYYNDKNNKNETFIHHGEVTENRNKVCYVYLDTFSNNYSFVKEKINDRFLEWCNDYKKITGFDPVYRTAELAYTGLVHKQDDHY